MAMSALRVKAAHLSKLPLIAIVDDDAAVREALGDLLLVAGISSRTYDGASAFLADYTPGEIDLVITDIRMPKMDGFELLRRLAALQAAPPAIVVTSSYGLSMRTRAIEMGALACLSKPVDEDVLLDLVGAALDWDENRPSPGK